MHSEQINEIASALNKVQSEIKPAIKDSDNPYFKSKYADLSAVWESCRVSLCKNGLSVTQTVDWSEVAGNTVSVLTTMLMHSSGQWISGSQILNPVKNDPQGIGSAITYARRYGLSAIIGIVSDEDDDGNAASEVKPASKPYIPYNSKPMSKADASVDIDSLKKMADKASVEERKQLAERMKSTGKYSSEAIKYVSGY